MPDYEKAARFLFDILDTIDTVGDVAKGDDLKYRATVERLQRRRFEVASVSRDGSQVIFYDDKGDTGEDANPSPVELSKPPF